MTIEKVSVIIAAHNDEVFITECLESVIAAQAAEIIVVDDASTDATMSKIAQIDAAHLRVIPFKKNKGPSAARNAGLSAASYRYCAIVDADDVLPSDRFSVMVEFMKRTAASIILDDLVAFNSDTGEVIRRQMDRFPIKQACQQLSVGDMIKYDLGSLKPLLDMTKVNALGVKYPEDIRQGEDFLFLLGLLKRDASIFATRATHYQLRRNTKQRLTSNRYRLFSELLRNEIAFHRQYSWTLNEHLQLTKRHLRNTLGLSKNAVRASFNRLKPVLPGNQI